jgi:methylphosphotriester-DNA--protein-cysteine methyltransferase
MAYTTDAARWRALATRDANANGHFIYTVKSTNIYCRPTCPARLARRANVGFYKTSSEAEANGFRACKRCKPDTILEDSQTKAVVKACMLIEEATKNDDMKALRLQDLAQNVGLTPRYFHKIFKDKTGVTPKEWAKAKTRPQSSSIPTPSLTASPPTDMALDTFDWEASNYTDFNGLVDFDMDGSATLGYNLATGAAQPVSMGYGNAIDVNILDELWTSEYLSAGLYLDDGNVTNVLGECGASISAWSTAKEQPSVVSACELDVDALLRFDTVLF